jgi:hypothetical protein
LEAIVDQFGRQLHVSNVADLKLLLGPTKWKSLLLQSMSAVEHQVDGKKQVFVPGLGSNHPLQNLVGFLSELKSSVDSRLLVECNDVTSVSTALITKRGGRSAVGKALQPFRKLLPAFVRTHRAVIFATGNASRSADWEMQIVRLLEDLRPCRVFSELFTSKHREGFGVGRPSGSLNSSCFKKA